MVSTVPLETAQKSQKRLFACFTIILLVIIGFAFSNRNSYFVNQNPSDPYVISQLLSEIQALKASEKAHQEQISQLTLKLNNNEEQFKQLYQEIQKRNPEEKVNLRQLSIQKEESSDSKAYDDELFESQQMYENIESKLSTFVTMENLASVVEYYEEKFEEISRELDVQKKTIRESREDLDVFSSYDEEEEEDKKEKKEPLEKVRTFVKATEKKLDKIKDIMVDQAGEVKEASKKLGKEAEKEAHKLLKKAQDLKDSIVNVFHH